MREEGEGNSSCCRHGSTVHFDSKNECLSILKLGQFRFLFGVEMGERNAECLLGSWNGNEREGRRKQQLLHQTDMHGSA